MLEAIEITTGEPVELGIIWLHGLGADGSDFVPLVSELNLARAARFLFPHAPERAVTINGGMRMRAWYDLLTLARDGPVDEHGIRQSSREVAALVERELGRGLGSSQIVLAGFSQGGAIALHTAIRFEQRLAGMLGLSTYLPLPRTLAPERNRANDATPIWLGHGDQDPVIDLAAAIASKDELLAAGYRVEWHRYEMGHSVCEAEIRDIESWLNGIVVAPRPG